MRLRWWVLSLVGVAIAGAALRYWPQPPGVKGGTLPARPSARPAEAVRTRPEAAPRDALSQERPPPRQPVAESASIPDELWPGREPSGSAIAAPSPRAPLGREPPPRPPKERPPLVIPMAEEPPPPEGVPGVMVGFASLTGGAATTDGAPAVTTPSAPTLSPVTTTPSSGGGTAPGGTGPAPPVVVEVVAQPPRFRHYGIAIGEAVDIEPAAPPAFPLRLSLTYDPREPQAKGVPPELLQVFFFDEATGQWSTQGLTVNTIHVSEGQVEFETTHLTVFRLGVPRGTPPLIQQIRPGHGAAGRRLLILGRGFSPPASQNILTLGGAFVHLALDSSGHPQALNLSDAGDTLILRDAGGVELDRASLPVSPADGSSWTRARDGDAASAFVDHASASAGRLFSPGTQADGEAFAETRGGTARRPVPGDVLINEALLAPPRTFLGDANGDGETHPLEDEFIELLNAGDEVLDLSGCVLHTGSGERHRFPPGTQLPAGRALVLFGLDEAADPPQPSGPFGGLQFLPDLSAVGRLIARIPDDATHRTEFLTVTTLRQTSNPLSLQVLSVQAGDLPDFVDASDHLPRLTDHQPHHVRLGDLDRDLDIDVIAADQRAGVVVLSNDGTGRFAEALGAVVLPGGRNRFFDLAIADLTEDGAPELLLGDTNPAGTYTQLIVLSNSGGGQWSPSSSAGVLTSRASLGPQAFDVGDVDDDGDLDVVVVLTGEAPLLFRNDGQGHFSHDPASDVLPQDHVVAPTDAELADVDGDGDLDLVLAAGRAGLGGFPDVQLFLNGGAGRFEDATADRLPHQSDGVDALAIGDLDDDDDLDLITTGRTAPARLYRNDGTGRFTLELPQALAGGRAPALALGDLDGDGDLDLILSQAPRDEASLNDGHGVFSAPALLPPLDGNHHDVAVGDVDEDGDLDVIGGGPGLTLLLNQGARENHAPHLDPVAEQSVTEGTALVLEFTARDDDGDPLTLSSSLRSGEPVGSVGAAFMDHGEGRGTLRWIPGPDQGARGGRLYEFVVRVSDGIAGDEVFVRVLVHALNRPPQLDAIAPRTVDELVPLAIQLQAQDEDVGDVLTFGSVNRPSESSLNSSSGLFQWTPGPTQGDGPEGFLDYSVRFTVTDLAGATVAQDAAIRVLHRNHAPEFADVSPQTVAEGQTLVLPLVVTDPDGDQPTVTELELPTGADFDGPTRTFTWTPDFTQARADPYRARFEATDQELSTQFNVAITVLDTHVNQPPVLGALSDQTVREGHFLQFAIPVSDADGDALTVGVTPLPRGARVFRQGAVWLFQWVPGADQSGSYPLTVEATDDIVASPVTRGMTINVLENPGLQRLVAQVGRINSDAVPVSTPGVDLGTMAFLSWTPDSSLVLDLGEVHPALVSMLEVFHSEPAMGLIEADLSLWVSDDNVAYQAYAGPKVVSASGNRLMISNLNITQRYIKIHRLPSSDPQVEVSNFLPEIVRASGAIPLDAPTAAFLEDLAHKTFLYFTNHVNANGLIPDRVRVADGEASAGEVFSTGATGFWLASLPIAAERGWMTQADAQNAARRTLEFYLGEQGGPVEGHLGFYHHFLNGDGTRFTGFGDDGVSTIDSAILFMGALACGEYFGGDIETFAMALFNRAHWEGFYDHGENKLHQVWTLSQGFGRHIDYASEGILAYLLAAGSTTHPITSGADLPGGGADAYYAFSRGNYGRILGRFGRDGRPLLQSYFGSLFTYLYPTLLMDFGGLRDAFYFNWEENTREAILANFNFAQNHPEAGYSRLYWGLSASDGPHGYQALYGAPPLDPGSGGVRHDGTVAPYALAGSLPFAADLALPALQHLAALQGGRLFDRYGLKSGVNLQHDFFDPEYLGIDQGALLLGLERYRTGQVAQLVRQSPVMQQALAALGLQATPQPLVISGPRAQHAYLIVDSSEHLTQRIQVARANLQASGDLLLELHPFGMDSARGDRFVDVELRVNEQFLSTVRFLDRRGTGTVDVGSVYVPIGPSMLAQETNTIELKWVGGERWVQLQDVELNGPTGRKGDQEFWQIGSLGSPFEFGDERRVNESYLVGDDVTTLEQALNVVDEPITDILFELEDPGVDRRIRLAASDSQDGLPITVEITVNDASVGTVRLARGEEASAPISHLLLRNGWNHIRLRHANVPTEGDFITWDMISLDPEPGAGALQVMLRNVQGNQLAPQVQFGLAPKEGAVMSALQYLEIHYQLDQAADRMTISTDNRNAPIHRFTGPESESAAGLVGAVDSTIRVPLLWQVYDTTQPAAPAFSDDVEWAYIPDLSDPDFTTPAAINYRTLVSPTGLGDRPTPGRSASTPVYVYLTADFRGKPAQPCGTDRLFIEVVQQ